MSSEESRIQYVSNGENTEYETPFEIFIDDGVEIYFDDELISSDNYSVVLNDDTQATITFNTAPQSGVVVTIMRNIPIERTTQFQEGGALRASTLNYEFDYQMACIQDLNDDLSRAMIYPPYATSTDVDLTLPSPKAGKSLIWNADGTRLENSVVEVNTLGTVLLEAKETAVVAAEVATEKAEIATEKAELATEKVQEISDNLETIASVDMDNISDDGKAEVVNWIVPDYSAGVSISTGYVCTEICFVVGIGNHAGSTGNVYVNGVDVGYLNRDVYGNNNYAKANCHVYCDVGDVITFSQGDVKVYPLKGVN